VSLRNRAEVIQSGFDRQRHKPERRSALRQWCWGGRQSTPVIRLPVAAARCLCIYLAKEMARDGEAPELVEFTVSGAATDAEARPRQLLSTSTC
jgi:hypothetical protein